MSRPSEDDKEAIDRAFAELVAGYHLTAEPGQRRIVDQEAASERDRLEFDHADRDPVERAQFECEQVDRDQVERTHEPADPSRSDGRDRNSHRDLDLDSRWADQHPLFSFSAQIPEPEPEPVEERYDPGPPPPWPHPSAAVLVGWIGVAYAVLTMVAAALGAPVPRWAGWMAVGAFVGGFALLLSRLPRHRPPDSGDGAVL